MTVVFSLLTMLILGLVASTIGPIIPWVVEEFAISFGVVGRIFLFNGLGRVLTSVLIGFVGSRLQSRQLITIGIGCMGSACLGIFFFPSFGFLLAGGALWGAGWGFLESGLNSFVSQINPGRSGRALNQLHLFFGVGSLVGPMTASLIAVNLHWRFVYLLLGVLFATALIGLRREMARFSIPEPNANAAASFSLNSPLLWLMSSLVFLYVSVEVGIGGWLNTFWSLRFAADQVTASAVLSAFWVALTLGRLLCMGLVMRTHRVLFLRWLFATAGSSLLLLQWVPHQALGVVFVVILGTSLGGVFPTVASISLDHFPDRQVSVAGFLSAAAGTGVMLGPWIAGILWDYVSAAYLPIWGLFITLLLLLALQAVRTLYGQVR